MHDDQTITAMTDRVREAASDETISVAQITAALGRDSLPPNLMIPALAVVSPLSGVPLFSSVCGLLIALISAQMLLGRDHVWLPGFLMRRKLGAARVRGALDWMRRPAGFLDRITAERLTVLVRRPMRWITQALCLCCGLLMPFLELIPFTSSMMGVVVSLLAFGMLARDGLFTALGLLAIGGLAGLVLYLLP
ncbi:exopolysaccharide biosynthesis protein [Paracoccus liaowanqingii]|uniref:Exopolysaccharide biosynthesis protein n=1 Tax=Paracoccus liaowanqingii TaxID=2560053 RepID=A0A4V1BIE9_9RHOB|nr:exopolysaccharide biosynthesis protein [Paracoccus liaowanqingii]QBX33316.1 exopolysaccharide biosynthesis protein [Paracoccus liaowanqingii]